MRILIAPDKFKGSIGSVALCALIGEEIHALLPDASVTQLPLADGGDGFAEIVRHYFHTHTVHSSTTDPLGRDIEAAYQFAPGTATAYIEMSAASGLALLRQDERDPMRATTRGTGQLIADAISRGARQVVLGIGGSATNDAGTGMAYALGYRFLDGQGGELEPNGGDLQHMRTIIPPREDLLRDIDCVVACDVKNPLYGPAGAACVYGPQKGATPDMVGILDRGLRQIDEVFMRHFGRSMALVEGAGAAGGLGAGASLFLGARMVSGMEYLSAAIGLEEQVAAADLIITGEGRFDEQSFQGKVVGEVAALAGRYRKELRIICGSCAVADQAWKEAGIGRVATLTERAPDLATAIAHPEEYVRLAIRSWWPSVS